MQQTFGILAGLLGVIGAFAYLKDTYFRKTKPHRIAWFTFLILSIISFFSQVALGAKWSLLYFGWTVINNLAILLLSLRKNSGYGDITPLNVISFIIAMSSIVIWQTTDSPLLALVCALIADGLGALLILIKSYQHPDTETLIMWELGIVAALFTIFSVNELSFGQLAAPVQLLIFCILISLAIITKKPKRKANKKSASRARS